MPPTPHRSTAGRPAPTTLQALAEQEADETHRRRLAELKTLAPLLARLDPLVPQLKERGLTVWPTNLQLTYRHIGKARMKVLRIFTVNFLSDYQATRWFNALQDLGFAEVHRDEGPYATALMRSGTLYLQVDLPTPQPPTRAVVTAAPAAPDYIAEAA